jgi:hypothetical protein
MIHVAYTTLVSLPQLQAAYARLLNIPRDEANKIPTARLVISIRDACYRHARVLLFSRVHDSSTEFLWAGVEVASLANGSSLQDPESLDSTKAQADHAKLNAILHEFNLSRLPPMQIFS